MRRPKDRESLIRELQDLGERLGRVPVSADLCAKNNVHNSKVFKEEFGSFRNALKAAGYTTEGLSASYKWAQRDSKRLSDEELLEILRKLADDLGREPVGTDFNPYLDCLCITAYPPRFGSMKAARELAGIKTRRERKAADACCLYTKKDLIKVLRDEARRIGRPPSTVQISKRHNGKELNIAIKMLFGNLKNALKEADLSSEEAYNLNSIWT